MCVTSLRKHVDFPNHNSKWCHHQRGSRGQMFDLSLLLRSLFIADNWRRRRLNKIHLVSTLMHHSSQSLSPSLDNINSPGLFSVFFSLIQVHRPSWAGPSSLSPSWHLGSPPARPGSPCRTKRSTGSRSAPSPWPDVCLWSACTSLLYTHTAKGNHKSVLNERVNPNDGDELRQLILN